MRTSLQDDYHQIEAMLDRLEHGHLHIAAFGRVSVGKSATLNALLGEERFTTSPLHGETRETQMGQWQEWRTGGVYLVDTPGINEVDGVERERMAREVASRADLVLFIVDGDLTHSELTALRELGSTRRPLILVLNKADRYTNAERVELLASLRARTAGLVAPENVLYISARPAERWVIRVMPDGSEREERQRPPVDIKRLKERLWAILEAEGQILSALNASLFASDLSDKVSERILTVRRSFGERLIRTYCVAKGVAVALNPVPVADLIAAAVVDVTLVVHLSRLYGLPLSRTEAGRLIRTISGQMALLVGTIWTLNVLSSALKLGSGGLSSLATGAAQGAVAYYSTLVVGNAAERYLAQGKAWGEGGPKRVVREILDSLDRDSVMAQARSDIRARLRSA